MRLRIPADRGRLAGKPMARQRRDHDVECVRRIPAMGCRVGQRIDDLQLLDDRAGPPVRDDDRQGVRMLRTNMDEMNVHPSIVVMNCGKAFSLASTLRQSYSVCQ